MRHSKPGLVNQLQTRDSGESLELYTNRAKSPLHRARSGMTDEDPPYSSYSDFHHIKEGGHY